MLKKLFFERYNYLFCCGLYDGKIVPFKNIPEIYEEMSHTYIHALPVSLHIKYMGPKVAPGRCYERSLYMFFSMKDAVLVRGDLKLLEYKIDKKTAGHGWVEIGNYVYDPTYLCRFEKELYYKMNKISNIKRITLDEYLLDEDNKKFYENLKQKTIDDFKPNGKYRFEIVDLAIAKGLADNSHDKAFKNEVYAYLNEIEYDSLEKDINDRLYRVRKQKN